FSSTRRTSRVITRWWRRSSPCLTGSGGGECLATSSDWKSDRSDRDCDHSHRHPIWGSAISLDRLARGRHRGVRPPWYVPQRHWRCRSDRGTEQLFAPCVHDRPGCCARSLAGERSCSGLTEPCLRPYL